jgi:hypothetical protein
MFIAKPRTIEAAIRRTESELFNIDIAWGGKGPSRLAGLGLSLEDKEEKQLASQRLRKLNDLLITSRMVHGR